MGKVDVDIVFTRHAWKCIWSREFTITLPIFMDSSCYHYDGLLHAYRVVKDPRLCLCVTISGSLRHVDVTRIHMSHSLCTRVTFIITLSPYVSPRYSSLSWPFAWIRIWHACIHARKVTETAARRRACLSWLTQQFRVALPFTFNCTYTILHICTYVHIIFILPYP